MSEPRIVIHIGAQKTGSTFLQWQFRNDPEEWRAHGVHVPVLPEVERLAGNAKLLAAVLGGEAPAFRRGFPDVDPAALDPAEVVSRLLADWRREQEVLLLSAENFSALQAQPLRDLLPTDVTYTVVLFVRNQCSWIESNHRQLVKMMLFDAGMHEFVDAVLGKTMWHYPDWLATYDAWCEAFGACRVVLYEEAAADLLGAFAAAAELPVPSSVAVLEPQNESPDALQIAYLLELQRPIDYPDFVRRRTAATEAARRAPSPRLSFLAEADRERLRVQFEPVNRRLLELLGRSYEGSPLDLSDTRSPGRVSLGDLYRSKQYKQYKQLANSVYAAWA